MAYSLRMAKSSDARKTRHVTVRMTAAMFANLKRLSGSNRQMADVIREAIRQYLDDQGELTGSRRYFTGRFRDEVHALRRELAWHQTLNTILMAEMFSFLTINLFDLDEKAAETFTPSGILKIAEERMVDSGGRVRTRVEQATSGRRD